MTSRTKDFGQDRVLDTHVADRSITRDTPVFRLNYIRVTACRTDFAAGFKPPGL